MNWISGVSDGLWPMLGPGGKMGGREAGRKREPRVMSREQRNLDQKARCKIREEEKLTWFKNQKQNTENKT